MMKSYHKALLLKMVQENFIGGTKPFRFHACQLADDSFMGEVCEPWNESPYQGDVVSKFHYNVDFWNKNCYGNLFHKKQRLLAILQWINAKLSIEKIDTNRTFRKFYGERMILYLTKKRLSGTKMLHVSG